jgi:cytochrome c553
VQGAEHNEIQQTKHMNKTLIAAVIAGAFGASSVMAAEGQETWDKECAKCHGKDGAGQTTMGKKLKLKDYTDAAVQAGFTDEEAFKAIKEGIKEDGKTRMKGYEGKLSDEEITALVAHVRSLKK